MKENWRCNCSKYTKSNVKLHSAIELRVEAVVNEILKYSMGKTYQIEHEKPAKS